MGLRTATVCIAVAMLLACVSAHRSHWKLSGGVRPESRMQVTIGLALPRGAEAALADSCKAVSDPTSPSYGAYLTREQVAAMSRSDANMALVTEWLSSSAGITDVVPSPTGDALVAQMSVAQAELAFGVRMGLFSHKEVPRMRMVRALEKPTTIPTDVSDAIQVLSGVADFPTLNRPLVDEHKRRAALAARVANAWSQAEAKASQSGSSNTLSVPDTPTVGLMYVSDTQATLMTILTCGDSGPASGPVPCAGTNSAISNFEAEVWVDGSMVESALTVNLDAATPEIQPSPTVNMTVYNIAIPYTLQEFQSVNVSIRAVNSAGKSGFATLPWKNLDPSLKRMVATPYVTPGLLEKWYGLGDMPSVPAGATQAVAEFGSQWYSPVDLQTFYKRFDLPVSEVTVVGSNDGPQSGGEATLDIQYITGVAQGVHTFFWSVSPPSGAVTTTDEGFLFEWAQQVNAATTPPLLTSISYGLGEDQYVQDGFGADYIARTNTEFLKLCSRGAGILVAAGDAGSSNDGHGSNSCAVQPDFPSSSPWVTTVSASFISNKGVSRPGQNAGEVAVSIPNGMFWTTGGGFSSEASCEQPWYQQKAVATYLQRGAGTFPPTTMFNASLRAYPDVSAIGHNLMCEWAGTLVSIDGTSASSPIFAGILSRLNVARLNAGKPALGFANPLLYSLAESNPTVFYDITVGDNKCAGFTCCQYGYACEKGYDAVSGLGAIGDFSLLEKLVLAAAQ